MQLQNISMLECTYRLLYAQRKYECDANYFCGEMNNSIPCLCEKSCWISETSHWECKAGIADLCFLSQNITRPAKRKPVPIIFLCAKRVAESAEQAWAAYHHISHATFCTHIIFNHRCLDCWTLPGFPRWLSPRGKKCTWPSWLSCFTVWTWRNSCPGPSRWGLVDQRSHRRMPRCSCTGAAGSRRTRDPHPGKPGEIVILI